MALPEPGQKFEGKYSVVGHIGSGGFAEVYKATDPTGRPVAIKVLVPLHAEWAQNDPIVERFEREGKLLGQLTNEHTVNMLEMGRTSDGVSPYIVFEYIDGADLAQVVEQQGPMPVDRVVQILQQVCSALGEAHDLGVMHRDIKPANIMVYEHMGVAGLVKLLDFGIAKPTDGMGTSKNDLTSAGMVLGTPRYMAPEQFTGARAAPPSDIYSLGLVAYELVTGKMAVDAPSTTGIFRQQLSPEEFKIPRSVNISPGLRSVILKMTRKTRGDRYQTVHEVLADLRNLDRVQPPAASRQDTKKIGLLAVGIMAIIVGATGLAGLVSFLRSDANARPTYEAPVIAQVPPPTPRPRAVDPPDEVAQEVVEKPQVEPAQVEPDVNEAPKPVAGEPDKAVAPAAVILDVHRDGPPPDDIVPLELESAAAAKNIATRALTMGDWERVIAACKPYGAELTFCARWLADAYRSRGNIDQACYWFEVVSAEKTGLNCPYEERRRDKRMRAGAQ